MASATDPIDVEQIRRQIEATRELRQRSAQTSVRLQELRKRAELVLSRLRRVNRA